LIETYVSARQTNAANRAGYRREALVYRAGGGATIEGAVGTDFTRESNAAWEATIAVSGNNALITVNGAAGATINWKVKHFATEVS
jgi:hypothetical protein